MIFRRRIHHLSRYREIATVLARNGFGLILEEMGLSGLLSISKRFFHSEDIEDPQSLGQRLRKTLEELGPTFIKIGQIASTRPDIIPENIIVELEKLQDQVSSFSFDEVSKIIKEELGFLPDQVFKEFDERPLATASIGQVHRAILKSGEKVAVKIQRPRIIETIENDLEILLNLGALAERRLAWAKHYRVHNLIEELARSLHNELDYTVEARNADKIGRQFKGDSKIRIPKVYWDYSRKRVLTLEFIDGVKLNHIMADKSHYDCNGIAEKMIQAMFQQIMMEGFFHGDPHPGNIFVINGEVVSFIDFGMVGRLDSQMKYHFASLVIGMIRQKTEDMIDAICKMGMVPRDINERVLYKDVDMLREKYMDVPLSQVHLGEAVNELFQIAFKHKIMIPSDFVLLGKSLLSLEGIVEQLAPEISIMDVAKPFGTELVKERLSPSNLVEKAWYNLKSYTDLLMDMPKQIKELLNTVRSERIQFEVYIPELAQFLRKFDRVSNQISFSIVLLSFSILMSGLVIASALGTEPSILGRIPAMEISFLVAIVMFAVLLISIFRSGRF